MMHTRVSSVSSAPARIHHMIARPLMIRVLSARYTILTYICSLRMLILCMIKTLRNKKVSEQKIEDKNTKKKIQNYKFLIKINN